MVVRHSSRIASIWCRSGYPKVSASPTISRCIGISYGRAVDVDILKPNSGFLTVERPQHTLSRSASERLGTGSSGLTTPDTDKAAYVEPESEGEEDEAIDLAPARDEGKRTGLTGEAAADAIAYREKMLKEREDDGSIASSSKRKVRFGATTHNGNGHNGNGHNGNGHNGNGLHAHEYAADGEGEADERTPFLPVGRERGDDVRKPRTLSIDPLAPASAFDETFKDRLRAQETRRRQAAREGDADEDADEPGAAQGDDRILVRDFSAPAGKRVAIPVRIEPKVYFATERTFLVRPSSHSRLALPILSLLPCLLPR